MDYIKDTIYYFVYTRHINWYKYWIYNRCYKYDGFNIYK